MTILGEKNEKDKKEKRGAEKEYQPEYQTE